jgi:tRNA threonylcarbamoyladenosine biosynthesis protein TsaB
MKLLAIETSSATASIALRIDDKVTEHVITSAREQTARILPLIDALLAAADIDLAALDAVAFGRGPGSFTGLRVAAAVAQGLGLAAGVPIVAVSSLAALAQRALDELDAERILTCVDARMGEVYWGGFESLRGLAAAKGPEALSAPEALRAPAGDGWIAVGDGCAAYADALAEPLARASRIVPDLVPRARDVLPLAAAEIGAGRFIAPALALPAYLRDASAWRRIGEAD